jgi:hypothetical protein
MIQRTIAPRTCAFTQVTVNTCEMKGIIALVNRRAVVVCVRLLAVTARDTTRRFAALAERWT